MPDPAIDQIDSNDPAFLYLNLHPEEEIKIIVRHHPVGFLGTLLIVFAMVLAPILLLVVFSIFFKDQASQYMPILVLFISAFILFVLTFLLASFVNYYFDIVIVTNQRLINVDQEGLLARETSELDLRQVEDVTAEVQGLLRSLFNYGLLVIETAGEGTTATLDRPGLHGYFTVTDIPDPNKVARVIIDLHRLLANEDA
jgi:ABC-type multidrug transport system fused ATPase/permease subunit